MKLGYIYDKVDAKKKKHDDNIDSKDRNNDREC